MKDKGFGDTVERITRFTGIKEAVEVISLATGQPCGCEERKEFLNKKIPYRTDGL
jgi:hypothetical protein